MNSESLDPRLSLSLSSLSLPTFSLSSSPREKHILFDTQTFTLSFPAPDIHFHFHRSIRLLMPLSLLIVFYYQKINHLSFLSSFIHYFRPSFSLLFSFFSLFPFFFLSLFSDIWRLTSLGFSALCFHPFQLSSSLME